MQNLREGNRGQACVWLNEVWRLVGPGALVVSFVLTLLCASGPLRASEPPDDWAIWSTEPYAVGDREVRKALEALADGKVTPALVKGLDKVEALSEPSRAFFQGWLLWSCGKKTEAADYFRKAASQSSPIRAHAGFLLAACVKPGEEYEKGLRQALASPGLRGRALGLLVAELERTKRQKEASELLFEHLSGVVDPEERARLTAQSGRLLIGLGEKRRGFVVLSEAWLTEAGRPVAEPSLKSLYGDDWNAVVLFRDLHLGGKNSWSEGLSRARTSGPPFAVSMYEGALARAGRRKEQALKEFESAASVARTPMEKAIAGYFRGRALESLDRDLEAREIYLQILDSTPMFPLARGLMVRVGIVSNREGLATDGLAMLERYVDGIVPGENAAEGIWQLAFLLYLNGEYTRSSRLLSRLESEFFFYVRSAWEYYGPMAIYWRAQCLVNLGKDEAARDLLRKLATEFPGTYYGALVISRGGIDCNFVKPADFTVSQLKVSQTVHWPVTGEGAVELFRLGLWDEAFAEFRGLMGTGMVQEGIVGLAASSWLRCHKDGGSTEVRRQLGTLPAPWESGARMWRRSIPLNYAQDIQRVAVETELEPSLLAAVIRFESGFSPGLESHAGAVGLLQVKTNAGSDINRLCYGGGDVSKKELKDPKRNLALGSRYIRELVRRHNGNWAISLAAYNAGPGTARWWLGRFAGLNSDELIEYLTYPNAIGYVKRITGVIIPYWALYHPILGRDRPLLGLPRNIPVGLGPFLGEPGGGCPGKTVDPPGGAGQGGGGGGKGK